MGKKIYVRNIANTNWEEVVASLPEDPGYLTQSSASSTYATINYVNNEINDTYISLENYADNVGISASAAAVTYLTDAAPSTLDTLNELAAALGNDENYATTITTALGNKLDISSASSTYIPQSSASVNQIIYKDVSNNPSGSSGLTYDGTSIKVNGNLESIYSNGDEGGEIFLNKPATNTSITNGVTLDLFQNKLRFFENGSNFRGAYIDITSLANSIGSKIAVTSNESFTGNTSIQQVLEKITVSASAATGTINYDVLNDGGIEYYTSNATGNWTLNVRGSSSATLNSILSVGQSLTIVFMVTNGGTAYYQTGFQIDGSSITPKWQGGSAPASGNTNSIDVYSFSIIKTAATPTYTVLGSQVRFA